LLDIGDNKLVGFANRSMVTGDLANQVKLLECKIGGLTCELDNMKICAANLRTPSDVLSTFIELQQSRETAINKRRKEIERHIQQIRDEYKYVEQDMGSHQRMSAKEGEIADLQSQLRATDSYIRSGVGAVMSLLKDEGLVEGDLADETTLKLSVRGKLASQLKETHCLIFSKLLEDRTLDSLSARQLVSLFSIFTNISVEDDLRDGCPKSEDPAVQKMAIVLTDFYTEYRDKEHQYRINTGFDYNIQYDLLNYVDEWCGCEEVDSCKFLLQKMGEERHIFLGEFVKALLKINNISCELEKLAELTGNIAFLNKLKEIPAMTLKYVVTNQSLYV
jgi:hypothetical protein